jgi:HAD superfamily hydrolase (TIGR01509 family)
MKCAPIFHHKYALSRLKSEGYKLAVCSNSVKNSVITMMSSADLMQYLEFVISNEDVEISKPNPEMYNLAVSKLNLSPKECLILEDNEHGIKAAMASGCNLLKIGSPEDVTYNSILKRIKSIELQGI